MRCQQLFPTILAARQDGKIVSLVSAQRYVFLHPGNKDDWKYLRALAEDNHGALLRIRSKGVYCEEVNEVFLYRDPAAP